MGIRVLLTKKWVTESYLEYELYIGLLENDLLWVFQVKRVHKSQSFDNFIIGRFRSLWKFLFRRRTGPRGKHLEIIAKKPKMAENSLKRSVLSENLFRWLDLLEPTPHGSERVAQFLNWRSKA